MWPVACQASLSKRILQARILEWVAFPFSRGSSQPRDLTQVSHIAGTLSVRPTLSFPHCAHKSVLYVCVSITKAITLSKPRSQNYLAPFDLTSKQIAIKSIKLSLSLSYLDKYFKVKKSMAYQIFYMIF